MIRREVLSFDLWLMKFNFMVLGLNVGMVEFRIGKVRFFKLMRVINGEVFFKFSSEDRVFVFFGVENGILRG